MLAGLTQSLQQPEPSLERPVPFTSTTCKYGAAVPVDKLPNGMGRSKYAWAEAWRQECNERELRRAGPEVFGMWRQLQMIGEYLFVLSHRYHI